MINPKRIQRLRVLLWFLIALGLIFSLGGYIFNNDQLIKIGPFFWIIAIGLEIYLSNLMPAAIYEKIGIRLTHSLINNSVIIKEVLDGTPAAKAGLAKNSLVLEIERQKIYCVDDAYALAVQVWQKLENNQPVSIITGQTNRNLEKTLKK